MIDYEQICSKVIAASRNVANYISQQRLCFKNQDIRTKNNQHSNLVSYVDKTAEEMLINELKNLIPYGAKFITEEQTEACINHNNMIQNNSMQAPEGSKNLHTWIIDSLDGTTNFIHGMPPYAISIALMDETGATVVGVVHEITSQEIFYSWSGCSGIYLNESRVNVSEIDSINNSLLITGLAYQLDSTSVNGFVQLFDYFNRITHGTRRLGSAATNLAYVACGRADGFYQANLSAWDVAAGAFLIKQAGGTVTDFSLGNDYIFGKEIIASNGFIHEELARQIRSIINQK